MTQTLAQGLEEAGNRWIQKHRSADLLSLVSNNLPAIIAALKAQEPQR